jgi:lysine-specific demethylase 3
VIDCETEKIIPTSVGKFFESFKDPARRQSKGVWKLKDWPSSQDFQSAYPDLYNDFCDSLPVPDFTRREGVLNLYAHVCRTSYSR